jgi:hypothetical protein
VTRFRADQSVGQVLVIAFLMIMLHEIGHGAP